MFEIALDERARSLRLRLVGFLDLVEIERCAEALEAVHGRLSASGSGHSLLIDLTECAAQSQRSVGRLREMVEASPSATLIVVACRSALVAMQLGRVLAGREERLVVVADLGEAERRFAIGSDAFVSEGRRSAKVCAGARPDARGRTERR